MKKTLLSFLMISGMCMGLVACSSGDYNANPGSNANNSINPLLPLDSLGFNWDQSGADPILNANVNGAPMSTHDVYWGLNDSIGADEIVGGGFRFSLYGAYAGHIYSLGHNVMSTYASFGVVDTAHPLNSSIFYSYNGNSGEIQILQNDLTRIRAMFYFQAVSPTGVVTNITNGYFNVKKY